MASPEQPTPPFEPTAAQDSKLDPKFEPKFGWTAYAEQINGRFAMVGFVALLVLELWTRQNFFVWLGLL